MPIAFEAAADARGHRVGNRPNRSRPGPGLVADDALQVTHHRGERVRPGDGAEHVVGGLDVGDPVAHRLVDRVLRVRDPAVTGITSAPKQSHPGDVQRLARVSSSPM